MHKEAMNLRVTGKGYGSSWMEERVGEMSQLNYNFKINKKKNKLKDWTNTEDEAIVKLFLCLNFSSLQK